MNRIFGSALVLAAVACSSKGDPEPGPQLEEAKSSLTREEHPSVPEADQKQFVTDNAAFAAELYRSLVSESKANLWFSPHSITSALAMTYAGAAGNTATEMATALHYTLPSGRLHAAANWLDLELAKRATSGTAQDGQPLKLRSVNTLFAERTSTWKAPFLDTLAVNYGAGVNLMDFLGAPEASRKTINEWVSYKTEKKIDELLPAGSISSDTRLALVNAVYFNASWAKPFSASETKDADFLPLNAEVPTKVPTMHGAMVDANYAQVGDAEVVELPYSGNQTSMVIILPKAGAFSTWESKLDGAVLTTALSSLHRSVLDLSLPKFKIKGATISLAQQLKALGMKEAFSDTADFSAMSDTKLYVSDVLHQAFVDVNEKGTEAAAATAVLANESSMPETHTVKVDRPFFVAIRDRVTGGVLFAGRIVDPK